MLVKLLSKLVNEKVVILPPLLLDIKEIIYVTHYSSVLLLQRLLTKRKAFLHLVRTVSCLISSVCFLDRVLLPHQQKTPCCQH